MTEVDVAIVGGGLAGSSAAVMLGRAGINAALIDPRSTPPKDFRCEKLDRAQLGLLAEAGLADTVLPATTIVEEIWVSRYGRHVEVKPDAQCCFAYETIVGALRNAIPADVPHLETKVMAIADGGDRQHLTLADDSRVAARLVLLANGLNIGLRHSLGIGKRLLSPAHSISIGFDITPEAAGGFGFPALTAFPETIGTRLAYLTLFPIGPTMRANLFVYREMDDPWLMEFKGAPEEKLLEMLPSLPRLTGGFRVERDIRIRPIDLFVAEDPILPGVVLAGDAFSTSCPAAGTGASKVFVDIERLCHHHIPAWLETPGMGTDKIGAYYADPVKCRNEEQCLQKAFTLKAMSLDTGLAWRTRRAVRFVGQLGRGFVRRVGGWTGLIGRGPSIPALGTPRQGAA